jgi:hypothetical protein
MFWTGRQLALQIVDYDIAFKDHLANKISSGMGDGWNENEIFV